MSLEKQLESIHTHLAQLMNMVGKYNARFDKIELGMEEVKKGVAELNMDVTHLKVDVAELKDGQTRMEQQVNKVAASIDYLKVKMLDHEQAIWDLRGTR